MNSRIKRLLIITLIIFLSILILLLILLSPSSKTVKPVQPAPTLKIDNQIPRADQVSRTVSPILTEPVVVTLRGSEIALGARKFIDGLKTGPGDFTTVLSCIKGTKIGKCESTGTKSYIPGMIVSMYEDLYQKTNDQNDLNAATQTMAELMVKCQQDTSFCEMVFFPLFSNYQKTKDQQYLTAMKKVGEEFLLPLTANEASEEPINTFVLRLKKLLMIYTSTNDNRYLNKAKERLAMINQVADDNEINGEIYKENGAVLRKYDCQRYWAVDYQFYQSTKEPKYLANIKTFFDSIKLDKNYQKISEIVPVVTCGEALLAVYKETGEIKYLNTVKQLNRFAVKNFYDSELQPKFNADNGFIFESYNVETGNQANSKTLTENIWMVRDIIRASWSDLFEL